MRFREIAFHNILFPKNTRHGKYDILPLTFFLTSMSVSVPADFELTGDRVPSTLSSLMNLIGELCRLLEPPTPFSIDETLCCGVDVIIRELCCG